VLPELPAGAMTVGHMIAAAVMLLGIAAVVGAVALVIEWRNR
jgi:hypothetical protein